MIQYTNIQRIESLPFEEYLKIDAYSHSFLKHQRNGITEYLNVTDKMRLGSLVDALLTQPEQFDYKDPQASKAEIIARHIKESFPLMLNRAKPQISYTATMELHGLKMFTKVRPDWELEGFAPLDLKVTTAKNDKEFAELANYMGYPNQIWHQARMGGYKKGYIIPYSVKAKRCLGVVCYKVEDNNEFWENAVIQFGTV